MIELIHTVLQIFIVNKLKEKYIASLALIFINKTFVGGNGINMQSRGCGVKEQTSAHILCDGEALASGLLFSGAGGY
jgi:hypothetical protein